MLEPKTLASMRWKCGGPPATWRSFRDVQAMHRINISSVRSVSLGAAICASRIDRGSADFRSILSCWDGPSVPSGFTSSGTCCNELSSTGGIGSLSTFSCVCMYVCMLTFVCHPPSAGKATNRAYSGATVGFGVYVVERNAMLSVPHLERHNREGTEKLL